MGRKSLKAERTAMILKAFAQCTARYGLEGASLEKVAETAGVKRSIIRHYIGNREHLIHALTENVVQNYESQINDMFKHLPEKDTLDALLVWLYPDPSNSPHQYEDTLVLENLIGAADRYPQIRSLLSNWLNGYVDKVAKVVAKAYPSVDSSRCWNTAWGLICIAFNQESLSPLKLPEQYVSGGRKCARTLIRSLSEHQEKS